MKATKLYRVEVIVKSQIRIERLMNATDKQRTGLSRLTAQELVNLGTWLNSNAVLAPGQGHE
jgi:hypothetical protein